jgi:hypothetical protein
MRVGAGNVCIRELPWLYNSPLIMASCGSKGSTINISQVRPSFSIAQACVLCVRHI